MCYDLVEYDPFEPLMFVIGEDEYEYFDPMDDYDWEEWLDFDNGPV